MSEELKPCPFCGEKIEPPKSRQASTDRSEGFVAFAACYCGGYSATAHKMGRGNTEAEAIQEVIALWNRRAQPAEADGPSFAEVLEQASVIQQLGAKNKRIDELQAALSAVTAERDRLESMLIRTTTRHFAQQWKDRTDDKKLDECLSEGIAMLEDERDQYRAEVEAGGWIPLTKAMPPDGVPVLRWPGWAAEFSIDEWCNDYGCFLMSIEGGERATHWKPLCAPKAAIAAKEA